jgi:NodT family efflux transporter outer membrane factor (OMF) lipoprotein
MAGWRLKVVALILAATVGGCTQGPDFVPPPPPAVAVYVAADEGLGEAPGPTQLFLSGDRVSAAWWTLFHAPEIDALVAQGVAGSPTLASATARLTEAQETLAASIGAAGPAVDFAASATREKLNAASFGLQPNILPLPANFNVYQVGPTARYALDIFGGTRRQIEQTAALAEVRRHQRNAAWQSLTGNIVTEAIWLATLHTELQAIQDIIEIDRQNLGMVRTERRSGTVPDIDVASANSQLATDETLLPGPQQQLDVARHALAVLLGRPPADWQPPELDLSALTLPSRIPVSLPSALVHQRPDILAAEAQLHAASAHIGVATAQLYPDVTLSASIGAAALDPAHLFNQNGLLWSIAAGLSQPIFDGGMREAERRAALASFQAAAADYRSVVLQAFGQVADLLRALSHDGQMLAAEQRALDIASESMRLHKIRYSGGGSGILELLDAERQYQQARLGYSEAQSRRFRDIIQLQVAMGGGWWQDDAPAGESR